MSPIVRRTWSPCGKTPVLKHKTRSLKKISAIGAVTVRHSGRNPRIMFRLLQGRNASSVEFIAFLEQLLQNIRGKIIVIWDRLPAHRSKKLKKWLITAKRIQLEFLPPYAPELNPVEYLWSYLKFASLANFCPADSDELYKETKVALCKIRKQKHLIRSFIKHSPANFFA